MAETNLDIVIRAKDEAEAAFQKVNEHAEKLGDQVKKIGAAMTVAGGAIVAGLGFATKSAMDAQVETQKMDTILNAMGKNSKEVRDRLLESGAAAVKLGFDDEAASLSVAKLFQTTGDLTKSQELNGLAMDIARRKNISLEEASKGVNLALMGNGKMLKDLGIITKDAGPPMELLAEAQKRAGKSAQDFANTPTGKIEIMRRQYENLNETIGNILVPIMNKVSDTIGPIIDKIQKWAEENPKLFETIVIVVGAVGLLMAILGPILILLPALAAGFALLFSPIGLIVIAILALVAAGVAIALNWEWVKSKVIEIWESIKAKAIDIWNAITGFLSGIWASITGAITTAWNAIVSFFSEVWEVIKNIFNFAVAFITGLVIVIFKAMGIDIVAVFEGIKLFFQNVWNEITIIFNTVISTIQNIWNTTWTAIKNFIMPIWDGIKNSIKAAWDYMVNQFKEKTKPITEAWDILWKGLGDTVTMAWELVKNTVKSSINWIISGINAVINAINSVAKVGGKALGIEAVQIPNIPLLASGGIVSRPTLAMIGEAGPEAVVPLSRGFAGAGAGGITININGGIFGGRDAALEIANEIASRVKEQLRI